MCVVLYLQMDEMEGCRMIARQNRSANGIRKNGTRHSTWYFYWKYRYLTILFVPAVLYYAVFAYAPLYGIQIAFKEYMFNKGIWGSKWIGFDNFRLLFLVGSFREIFVNTIIISFYKLVWGFPAPIIFAILLSELRSKRFLKSVQTISYLPHFLSWVILAGLFMQFLSPSTGPVNVLISSLGLKPIYFLADKNWFRSVLVVTSIWKGVGWGSIIYFASISNINPEMYEGATVDGANRFQRVIYITIPSLAPVITIMLIFAAGNLIRDDFDQIFNLYNPAVYKVADVLSTYTYRMGLVEMKYEFSTAAGLFTNLVSFILVFLANFIAKRINEYGVW